MTSGQRSDRDLSAILDALVAGPYPDYVNDVLAITAQRRQRPAWAFPKRWLPMHVATQRVFVPGVPWRQVGIVAMLALLAAALIAVVAGTRPRLTPAPLFGPAANGLIPFEIDGDVYAGDPVTGITTTLLRGETWDMDPAFSRDGTQIAFRRLEDPAQEGVFKLFAMDADGADLREVTHEPLRAPEWWEWAPDGRSIVVLEPVDGLSTLRLYDARGEQPHEP